MKKNEVNVQNTKKNKKNKKRDWITHPIRNLYRMTTRLAAVNEWH